MARKKKTEKRLSWHDGLKSETKHSILAILCFAATFILALAAFGKAGIVGGFLQRGLVFTFGKGFFLPTIVSFFAGISFIFGIGAGLVSTTLWGSAILLVSALAGIDILFGEYTGGYVGFLVSYPLMKLFDFWASIVVFGTLFVASILIMLNASLKRKKKEEAGDDEEDAEPETVPAIFPGLRMEKTPEVPEPSPREAPKRPKDSEEDDLPIKARRASSLLYSAPPLDLLEDDKGTPSSGDIKANSNIIKRTLQTFGIDVEMAEVNVGPSVTQYTLKPAEGIKLSRIIALQSDLSLALAAHPLRIEAPIPGKSLVGIEVPNRSIALVGLRSLLGLPDFQNSYSLTIVMGRDVSGKAVFADIAKMPHLLIAGATGSGKSISIHTLIVSLLYKNSPEFLRLMMIDPKRVELSAYNEIPHLLTPVITDAKKAIMALRWAVKEMERRYEVLSGVGARDIASYNNQMLKDKDHENIMPNIVIIIDELADLMMSFPREVEASIVRLAQMSRAVGIHIVVSTQRPSVEVITGLIKANITARMALQVASGIDSRTILDMSGAEKLLGSGDMLYLAGDTSKPRRIQGAFISEKEVKKITAYLKDQTDKFETEEIDLDVKLPTVPGGSSDFIGDGEEGGDDELYEQARELVIEAGKASASYLQRRLRVGYARAARMLDLLEERGVIGPGEGAKPREVRIKKEGALDAAHPIDTEEENLEDLNNF